MIRCTYCLIHLSGVYRVTNDINWQLALQVLDILLKQDPDHIDGRRLHYRILEALCEADDCLMSRNTWVYFMDQDKELLKKKGVEL
ncbi:MAG: hypothetical protein HOE30_13605 [Deltaproteobacteria bacterium]|nr:hypothetical protein [Deltaproteobacteria bacterium]MBT4089518.1 hypothetical protein [Deltaproteobacteria bacterium]MBT4264460.1 hypothetical protein [Deltaproteobacteria bacterium]MBT4643577.1 hypothetical protein [Deltaproteobacteria bacterium]MBT6501098.1 hypothetical protein [Deltaproteobacteria bacterium]